MLHGVIKDWNLLNIHSLYRDEVISKSQRSLRWCNTDSKYGELRGRKTTSLFYDMFKNKLGNFIISNGFDAITISWK